MIVGIDYDSYKATLCALTFHEPVKVQFSEARWRKSSQSGDDAAIRGLAVLPERLGNAMGMMLADLGDVVYFIERGYGMSRRADWILGAYFGAIYATLTASSGAAVNEMGAAEWKREVTSATGIGLTQKGTGNGNAKKEIANEATRRLFADLFESGRIKATETPTTPDLCDAFAIAWTGRKLNARASQ